MQNVSTAKASDTIIAKLNKALALEMRAEVMYAHYAAYVKGIHRLHLKTYFEGEATESFTHAGAVAWYGHVNVGRQAHSITNIFVA